MGLGAKRFEQLVCGGGPLMIGRSSMGIFSGMPRGPGAAEIRAAMSYARSGLSTSTLHKPARNFLDSGNTPSVVGRRSLPARSSFA
jgi:hypothetical protein